MSDNAAHCLDLVRRLDRDRYLSALFAPDAARPHLLALYAFAAEIRRIPGMVSEPRIGLIRLQWWRDAIAAGTHGGHPVAEQLLRAAAMAQLPKQALLDLVAAHEFDLFRDPMPDVTALETYLGETSSRLILMAAMILDRPAAGKAAAAAGLAGVAHGLALILGDPLRRRPFLPDGMSIAMAAGHARRRLAEARALLPQVAKPILPAFLPASLAELYLSAVERHPDRPAAPSQLRRQLTMWWRARQDRF
jgi:phytoene synthase